MASWKKVIVSGSSISQLDNDAGYIASVGGGIVSASAEGDAQGQIKLNGVNVDANALGTGDSPTFVAVTANLTGNVTGNADTATALATARAFTTTGDVVLASANFDGSSNFTTTATIQAGAVENTMFAANAKTAISGAFTTTSASIASDIADIVSTEFALNIEGDSGNGIIDRTETLDVAGGDNITTSMAGNTLTVALSDNVVIAGNLTVQGTRTELNVANLNVEDQFILLNSGSASGDSGIIFGGTGDGVANAGHAIFVDDSDGDGSVFGFAENLAHNVTSGGTPTSKLGNITTTAGAAPSGAPTFQGVGTINIDTTSQDIWIYS